uniref:Uncharacterized protein n=1 Tax=Zooxanthella nutricula TaxID=1333877 RepID=A0A7S2VMW6_9DINO
MSFVGASGAAQSDEGQDLLRRWRRSAAELSQVDRVLEELQEEVKRFEVRKRIIASDEARLREHVLSKGLALVNEISPPAAKAAPLVGASPAVFSLSAPEDGSPGSTSIGDDGDSSPGSSCAADEWEQGLEVLNVAESRDRAAKLRAHCMKAANKNRGGAFVEKAVATIRARGRAAKP